MKSMRCFSCVLAVAVSLTSVSSRASDPKDQLRQYCGADLKVAIKFPSIMRWDCQSHDASTLPELEESVGKTHKMKDYKSFRSYSTETPQRSEWVFYSNSAVHYRAIFKQNEYQCLGVTTYCSGTEQTCKNIEARTAADLPPPLMPDTSKPGPNCSDT